MPANELETCAELTFPQRIHNKQGSELMSAQSKQTLNFVVLMGTVRAEPVTTELDDGSIRLTFDLVVGPGANAVPVTWVGRVSRAPRLNVDRTIALIGAVRRRFFRSNGALVSRTDVLATDVAVTPAKRTALLGSLDRIVSSAG